MSGVALGEGGGVFDAEGRLAEDRPCLGCEYDLRGMRAEEVCPECRRVVRGSLIGPMLVNAEGWWVRRLWLGVRMALLGPLLVGCVALFVITMVTLGQLAEAGYAPRWVGEWIEEGWSMSVAEGLLWLALACTVAGWWLLGTRDPSREGGDPQSRAGRRVRAGAGALVVGAGLVTALAWSEPWDVAPPRWIVVVTMTPLVVLTLALGAWGWSASWVARWLAPRAPDASVRRAGRRSGLSTIVSASMGLASLGGITFAVVVWHDGPPAFVRALAPFVAVWFLSVAASVVVWVALYVAMLLRLRRALRRVLSVRGGGGGAGGAAPNVA